MWQWNRLRLSVRIVPRAKGEKETEFWFECGTRLMTRREGYLLLIVSWLNTWQVEQFLEKCLENI